MFKRMSKGKYVPVSLAAVLISVMAVCPVSVGATMSANQSAEMQAAIQYMTANPQPVDPPKVNTAPVVTQAPVATQVPAAPAVPGEAPAEIKPVTVDLIIFAGQSNMSGNGGNAALAPVVPIGQGYEYRPASSPNALYPLVEPFGRNERGYISDLPQYQNGTLVSSFVTTYYSKTGVPVVAVPATRGGTDAGYWSNEKTRADLLSRFIKAKSYLAKNNFTVRHKYLVFLQGETDAVKGIKAADYKNDLTAAFQPLFANGLEQVFLITPGYAMDGIYSYNDVVDAQLDLCTSSDLFTVGSTLLHKLPTTGYLADAVHYNQKALNLVGSNAGANVAAYAGGGQ